MIHTERLHLRELRLADAGFIRELVNDADWLKHIGDRGVRTREDAIGYIENGPQMSYRQHGFGLWMVERQADRAALGICGLLKRDTLEHADLGFAFLPAARGVGYAMEAASACVRHARETLSLPRLLAIVSPTNAASIALLGKLGFRQQASNGTVSGKSDSLLYAIDFDG